MMSLHLHIILLVNMDEKNTKIKRKGNSQINNQFDLPKENLPGQ